MRWLSFYNLLEEYLERAHKWSNGIALGDTVIHRAVQREVFVQEKVKAIQKSIEFSAGNKRGRDRTNATACV